MRSNAILKIENIYEYCFIWSILASLHPCNNNHPDRVSNHYKQYFNHWNIQDFDFTNGFKYSDVHKINELTNLSKNVFEKIFYQDQNKWKYKLLPFEVSKIDSDKVIDLSKYKSHQALI